MASRDEELLKQRDKTEQEEVFRSLNDLLTVGTNDLFWCLTGNNGTTSTRENTRKDNGP